MTYCTSWSIMCIIFSFRILNRMCQVFQVITFLHEMLSETGIQSIQCIWLVVLDDHSVLYNIIEEYLIKSTGYLREYSLVWSCLTKNWVGICIRVQCSSVWLQAVEEHLGESAGCWRYHFLTWYDLVRNWFLMYSTHLTCCSTWFIMYITVCCEIFRRICWVPRISLS